MAYPVTRMRRLRGSETFRRLVRETSLHPDDFILPIFVKSGQGLKEEIASLPGVYRYSIDKLDEELKRAVDEGIAAVLLFGIPQEKDEYGTEAYAEEGIVQRAVRFIKEKGRYDGLAVITDVCLCQYTDHGHCGIVKDGEIVNDASVELLVKTAVSHARAGADIVAPSDMMDGRIAAIRRALDEEGFTHVPIMSYAVKVASALYGPFREAAGSTPMFGDRKSYQMDCANIREALREVELDVEEGADIVMVKPALPCLDIIRSVREKVTCPVAAYSVSGEYAMIKAAARLGWLDERQAVLEVLTGIKRAGADLIVTYFAKEAAQWLRSVT